MAETIYAILQWMFYIVAVVMTFFILLQEGKGGGLAALGGTKASQVEGVTNPIRNFTAYLAGAFFLLAIVLGVLHRPTASLSAAAFRNTGQIAPVTTPDANVVAPAKVAEPAKTVEATKSVDTKPAETKTGDASKPADATKTSEPAKSGDAAKTPDATPPAATQTPDSKPVEKAPESAKPADAPKTDAAKPADAPKTEQPKTDVK